MTLNASPRRGSTDRGLRLPAGLPVPLVLPLLLVGCMVVGQDYEAPQIDTPDAWHTELTDGLEEGRANLQTWWTNIDDPELHALIARATAGNLDLAQARWRIEEARAVRGIAQSDLFPTVAAVASGTRSRASEGEFSQLPGNQSRTDNFYSLGLEANWELDVWGGIRRDIESAEASFQAQIESYRDVLVLLYAEVALNYIQLRATQARIAAAESNIEAQQGTLQLTRDRYDAQIAPQLDVRQAELNLATTESNLPGLEALEDVTIQSLGVLIGEHPSALFGELDDQKPIPPLPESVPVLLPAELLRQRPDLRAAERRLASEVADIGVAEANMYPRFSLTGSFRYEQFSSTGGLFDRGNRAWSFGLPVQWDIFDAGNIRNQIAVQEAQAEQALLAYENAVLNALSDVEGSMTNYIFEIETRDALQRAVTAAQQSVELVETLYRTGLTDFQNVLDTQRSLFDLQDRLAFSEGQVVQNLIEVYRALGGGWSPTPGEIVNGTAPGTLPPPAADDDLPPAP